MALLTVTQSKRQATPVALVTPDLNGDSFPNTGREALLVQHTNPGGAARLLIVTTAATLDGEAVADKQVIVQPGETHLLGPFPAGVYSNPQGQVTVNYSLITDLKVAAVRIS